MLAPIYNLFKGERKQLQKQDIQLYLRVTMEEALFCCVDWGAAAYTRNLGEKF